MSGNNRPSEKTLEDLIEEIRECSAKTQRYQDEVLRLLSVVLVSCSTWFIENFSYEDQPLFFLRHSIKIPLIWLSRYKIYEWIAADEKRYLSVNQKDLQEFMKIFELLPQVDPLFYLRVVRSLVTEEFLYKTPLMNKYCIGKRSNGMSSATDCNNLIRKHLIQKITFLNSLSQGKMCKEKDLSHSDYLLCEDDSRSIYEEGIRHLGRDLDILNKDFWSLAEFLPGHLAYHMCPVIDEVEKRSNRGIKQKGLKNYLRNIVLRLFNGLKSYEQIRHLSALPQYVTSNGQKIIKPSNWRKKIDHWMLAEQSCRDLLWMIKDLHPYNQQSSKWAGEIEKKLVEPFSDHAYQFYQDEILSFLSSMIMTVVFAVLIGYSLRRFKSRSLKLSGETALVEELKKIEGAEKYWCYWANKANTGLFTVFPKIALVCFCLGVTIPGLRAMVWATPLISLFTVWRSYQDRQQRLHLYQYRKTQKQLLTSYFFNLVSSKKFDLKERFDNESCCFDLTVSKKLPDYVLEILFSDPDIVWESMPFHLSGKPMYDIEVTQALSEGKINRLVREADKKRKQIENRKKIRRHIKKVIEPCFGLVCYEMPSEFEFCLALSVVGDVFSPACKEFLENKGLFCIGKDKAYVHILLDELDFSSAHKVGEVKKILHDFVNIYQARPKKSSAAATFFRRSLHSSTDDGDAVTAAPKVKKQRRAKPPVEEPTSSAPAESAENSSVTGIPVLGFSHDFIRVDLGSFDKLSLDNNAIEEFKAKARSKAQKSEGVQGILFRKCLLAKKKRFDAYIKRLGVHGDERVLLKSRREGRYLIYFVEGADDHGKHQDISYPVKSNQRKAALRMPSRT